MTGERGDKPEGPARVFPFPDKSRDQGRQTDLTAAWEVELADLAEEEPGRRCRLSLDREPGRRLAAFLSATGLDSLVLVTEQQGRLTITADKATITRLVVWRALDLGLDFKVEFEA